MLRKIVIAATLFVSIPALKLAPAFAADLNPQPLPPGAK
jgi:hypothetical protein